MSSITAQQTKLDLELVLKENKLDIKNAMEESLGRSIYSMMFLSIRCINPGELLLLLLTEVYLERLAVLTSFISLELKYFGIYGAILPKCLTSPAMKESKAYKTYLGYATCVVPPKIARKFKKSSPSKNESDLVPVDEEPVTKGKRVKRSAKKSTTASATDDDDDEVKDDDDEEKDDDDDKSEGDEDRGVDSDDVQDKKADVGMTDAQQEKENLEITQEQVVEDAHVTITKKTKVPITSSSHTRMGATREEFMNFLSASHTDRINEQVRNRRPQILPEEVSNFAPPVIEKMIQESLNQDNLAKVSSQPQSTYKAVATLTKFELKKILIDKMNSSESYLTSLKHRECYDGLIKSYNLNKDFFSSYDVYSLKHSRDGKDKDKGPFARSDQGLKKHKTSKDADPTISLKTKDSSSRSSKGTKSQPKSYGKSVHAKEPEFENMTLKNDTRLFQKKLDWENLKGDDYPFDLSKPLPLIMRRNRQSVPVEFFIKNDLKYLQGGTSTMTYTTSTTKSKAAQYDLPGIEAMVPNIWSLAKFPMINMRYGGFHTGEINVSPSMHMHGASNLEEMSTLQNVFWLLSSLEDITKNIDMEYLPKRRWSTLEKKRAHCIIKDINKLLKERMMMRSLEKFICGRLYGTDLRLLQRTI
uniref:Uncharacterized protein n=1 Tax=Tanacetum cinerariifolium TaxID=118510 RepID=A0A6L2LQA2_TANCI|nr:hypothetical protein [Tanacetum cinerariifolium]